MLCNISSGWSFSNQVRDIAILFVHNRILLLNSKFVPFYCNDAKQCCLIHPFTLSCCWHSYSGYLVRFQAAYRFTHIHKPKTQHQEELGFLAQGRFNMSQGIGLNLVTGCLLNLLSQAAHSLKILHNMSSCQACLFTCIVMPVMSNFT